MIPLVGHVNELKLVRDQLEPIAKKIIEGVRGRASSTSSAR